MLTKTGRVHMINNMKELQTQVKPDLPKEEHIRIANHAIAILCTTLKISGNAKLVTEFKKLITLLS